MFEADAQTLKDLQILPAAKGERSVLALFDRTESYGGRRVLESIFRTPLSDVDEINKRAECIRYMETAGITLKIDAGVLDFIEHYYAIPELPSRYSLIDALRKRWRSKLRPDNRYYIISRAIEWLVSEIKELHAFAAASHPAMQEEITGRILQITESEDFKAILNHNGKRFSAYETDRFDHILRYKRRDQMRELLDIIYQVDVFQSVIKTKNAHSLTFPEFSLEPGITVEALRHLFLENPVANDLEIDADRNVLFITGANMAGKSTFMKAFGVAVYLAHMGFPVPAAAMTLPAFDGIFTTINVPDDLSLGYSHFYSEVKRIKTVAERVGDGRRYVVVFDELFRGTNVKDAHEATVTVIEAFAGIPGSVFIFSSHIIEAAEELAGKIPSIRFKAFRTEMDGQNLRYSYRLEEGISNDRFGMYIIRREGIGELLEKKRAKT